VNKEDLTAKDFLQHILEAADRVLRYTKGMGRKEFSADTLVQDAVIHNVEIIGEAANNLLEVAPGIGDEVSVDSLCPDSWNEKPRRARLFCCESLDDLGYRAGGHSGTAPADCEGAWGTANGGVMMEDKRTATQLMDRAEPELLYHYTRSEGAARDTRQQEYMGNALAFSERFERATDNLQRTSRNSSA
jgi:hypothetical protein